jgi:hypothetical protein
MPRLIVFLALLPAACSPTGAVDRSPVASLRAEELWNEYDKDPEAADRKYKGKYLVVSGMVIEAREGRRQIGLQVFTLPPMIHTELARRPAHERGWYDRGYSPPNVVLLVAPGHEPGFERARRGFDIKANARVVGRKKAEVQRGHLIELDDARPAR